MRATDGSSWEVGFVVAGRKIGVSRHTTISRHYINCLRYIQLLGFTVLSQCTAKQAVFVHNTEFSVYIMDCGAQDRAAICLSITVFITAHWHLGGQVVNWIMLPVNRTEEGTNTIYQIAIS